MSGDWPWIIHINLRRSAFKAEVESGEIRVRRHLQVFLRTVPVVFSQGEYRFAPSTGSYGGGRGRWRRADDFGLSSGRGPHARPRGAPGIRLAILAIILVCLFRRCWS